MNKSVAITVTQTRSTSLIAPSFISHLADMGHT